MRTLTVAQEAEVAFWRCFYNSDPDTFIQRRSVDLSIRAPLLPGLLEEQEKGLDFGSGLGSILEGAGLVFDAVDPLMDVYRELAKLDDKYIVDVKGEYPWILCVNVLDHDPQPEEIVKSIWDHLLPGGTLYFHVNLTDELWQYHFPMDEERVNGLFRDFQLVVKSKIRNINFTHFYAVYKKPLEKKL